MGLEVAIDVSGPPGAELGRDYWPLELSPLITTAGYFFHRAERGWVGGLSS